MDPVRLSSYLHDGVASHYTARVGDTIEIALPRIPLTAETEFIKVVPELEKADQASILAKANPARGEGVLSPDRLTATALKPGRSRIFVRAKDALSNERVENVAPLEITVDVR